MSCEKSVGALRIRSAVADVTGATPTTACWHAAKKDGGASLRVSSRTPASPKTAVESATTMYRGFGIDPDTDPRAAALLGDLRSGRVTLTSGQAAAMRALPAHHTGGVVATVPAASAVLPVAPTAPVGYEIAPQYQQYLDPAPATSGGWTDPAPSPDPPPALGSPIPNLQDLINESNKKWFAAGYAMGQQMSGSPPVVVAGPTTGQLRCSVCGRFDDPDTHACPGPAATFTPPGADGHPTQPLPTQPLPTTDGQADYGDYEQYFADDGPRPDGHPTGTGGPGDGHGDGDPDDAPRRTGRARRGDGPGYGSRPTAGRIVRRTLTPGGLSLVARRTVRVAGPAAAAWAALGFSGGMLAPVVLPVAAWLTYRNVRWSLRPQQRAEVRDHYTAPTWRQRRAARKAARAAAAADLDRRQREADQDYTVQWTTAS